MPDIDRVNIEISVGRTAQQRALLMTIRQALIMILGAIEDYLNIERSIIPRNKR